MSVMRGHMYSKVRVIALALVPMLCVPISAQSVNATMSGTVRDRTGSVIANATVTVTNTGTNISQSAHTNGSGEYNVLNLPPASYQMEIEAPGFSHYIQRGITLDVDQKAKIDVSMQIGLASNTVVVAADANTIDTADVTSSDVVTGSEIRNLPLNSRNPYSLIALTPGFAGSIGNNYNSVSYSINGSRQGYTDVLVDGIPGGFPTVNGNSGVGVFPSVDAINQFRVLGQNYPAEFGRSLGGILNTAFKSGTNAFHGTLFEFARNSVLDANDYFSKLNGKALPAFQRNQFGGLLNGPLLHDKLFFLASAELLRSSQAITTTATVPTLLQRQGDFSQTRTATGALVTIYNPFSTRANPTGSGYIRDAFANNYVPVALRRQGWPEPDELLPNAQSCRGIPTRRPITFSRRRQRSTGSTVGTFGWITPCRRIKRSSAVTLTGSMTTRRSPSFKGHRPLQRTGLNSATGCGISSLGTHSPRNRTCCMTHASGSLVRCTTT